MHSTTFGSAALDCFLTKDGQSNSLKIYGSSSLSGNLMIDTCIWPNYMYIILLMYFVDLELYRLEVKVPKRCMWWYLPSCLIIWKHWWRKIGVICSTGKVMFIMTMMLYWSFTLKCTWVSLGICVFYYWCRFSGYTVVLSFTSSGTLTCQRSGPTGTSYHATLKRKWIIACTNNRIRVISYIN